MSNNLIVAAVIIVVLICVLNIIFHLTYRNNAPIAGTLYIDESDITDVKMKMDCNLDIDELAKRNEIVFKIHYIPPSQNKQFTYRED